MSLEYCGYTKAKYKRKIYYIYSEPNYNDYTIQLIDNNYVFEVYLYEIDLIKEDNEFANE